GLVLSQFEPDFKATPWSFVLRNEVVTALGEVLIVAQADLDSGSMRSAEFALKQGKEIYVLPHRLKESLGTNSLLLNGNAKAIYDIDDFVSKFKEGESQEVIKDEFWQFCSNFPKYEDAVKLYKQKVFEAELEGKIEVKNGVVYLC
ncbi:MAG: DNA-processing protein DprA, partial [Epsilonproteobacteria bacterium]|nr:DNA-processing protein DprA [Campylobacterota bacterium]